jgi:hypothetical protein
MLFPALEDIGHRSGAYIEEGMDVIWHYDPGEQFVTLAMEKTHRIFDKPSYFRPTKKALATALVETGLQRCTPLVVVFNLEKMLPFGATRFGKGIREPKRDKLREPWFIPMGKIAALVPTSKAGFAILLLQR